LELSRYLASLPRYLAPKLRQRLLRDDVISDVIRPGSAICEDHIDTPYHTGIIAGEVGDGWGIVGAHPPKSGKYLSGNYHVKFGHFVNFSYRTYI